METVNGANSLPVVDPVSDLEQNLLARRPHASRGPDAESTVNAGSERNVLPLFHLAVADVAGYEFCSVARHLYGRTCGWANLPQFRKHHCLGRFGDLGVYGYSRRHGFRQGHTDDIQSCAIPGFTAPLEVAAPRDVATGHVVLDLHSVSSQYTGGRTSWYTNNGSGSPQLELCVVGSYPSQFRVHGNTIPSLSMQRSDINRADLIYDPLGRLRSIVDHMQFCTEAEIYSANHRFPARLGAVPGDLSTPNEVPY